MKRVKLIGFIALIAVFGLLIGSCGKVSKDIEGSWALEGSNGTSSIKIASDEFSYTVSGVTFKLSDKVKKDGSDKIKATLKDEYKATYPGDVNGTIKWKVDGESLTLSDGSGWLVFANGKYKKK